MKLTDARHGARMSQVDLAHAAGVTQATISRLESGAMDINKCSVATVARIAYALGVDITSILEDGWDDGVN